MALADFVERTKDILYGTGLGERPPIRLAAANANESTSGSLVTFTLDNREGEKIKKGDVLSVVSDTAATGAFAVYVTKIVDDTVTAVNGYLGSPVITGSDSGDLDSKVLEQNPLATDWKVHKSIETVIGTSLWPFVFKFATASHTPDLSSGQTDMAALDMEIESAWQTVGGIDYPIDGGLVRNVHSTVSANGVLGSFDYIDGSTCYTTTIRKFAVGDEDEDVNGLIEMVSTGAAAIVLGASVSEAGLARSSQDSQIRGQSDIAATLWRDFLTLRTNYSEGLARERPLTATIFRG